MSQTQNRTFDKINVGHSFKQKQFVMILYMPTTFDKL